jgi:hypothetical protein
MRSCRDRVLDEVVRLARSWPWRWAIWSRSRWFFVVQFAHTLVGQGKLLPQ